MKAWQPAGRQLHDAALLRRGFALRQEVCDEMLRRREEVEPFISGVFDAYVSNMALEGIWGGLFLHRLPLAYAACTWSVTS